ncbi:MAG: hypothetical protein V3T08_09725 [Gemmatimonadota bacterium]
MPKIFGNIRGTTGEFVEIGLDTPRTVFTGPGDPNVFVFPVETQPVNGDFFMGDGAFWRFDGIVWGPFALGTASSGFPRKVVEIPLIVSKNHQMTIHGTLCIEPTATLVIEGQVALED